MPVKKAPSVAMAAMNSSIYWQFLKVERTRSASCEASSREFPRRYPWGTISAWCRRALVSRSIRAVRELQKSGSPRPMRPCMRPSGVERFTPSPNFSGASRRQPNLSLLRSRGRIQTPAFAERGTLLKRLLLASRRGTPDVLATCGPGREPRAHDRAWERPTRGAAAGKLATLTRS